MPYISRKMPLQIEWGHCDPAGIVFNPRFFEFFDTATWHMIESALGVPKQQLAAHFDIFGIPLVDAGADFKIPLKFGDASELQSTIGEIRRSSFDVVHRIYKAGALAVDGRETRVWTGRDKANAGRIRAVPIPDAVIARLKTA